MVRMGWPISFRAAGQHDTRRPVSIQVCPVHSDESVPGVKLGDGSVSYTCPRTKGHPEPGPYHWLAVPQPIGLPELTGIAAELGLDLELPRVLATFPGVWVEYGLVEYAYTQRNPKDFAALVDRYGHTAIKASRYTVSSFLAGTLGILSRDGVVLVRPGYATGRWKYNHTISWWSLPPAPRMGASALVGDVSHSMSYVPGSTEP
jgi:hypothetical protein